MSCQLQLRHKPMYAAPHSNVTLPSEPSRIASATMRRRQALLCSASLPPCCHAHRREKSNDYKIMRARVGAQHPTASGGTIKTQLSDNRINLAHKRGMVVHSIADPCALLRPRNAMHTRNDNYQHRTNSMLIDCVARYTPRFCTRRNDNYKYRTAAF
jgi:hypothetical protein